jgi:hypothetical protein
MKHITVGIKDFSEHINVLRAARDETPFPAAVPSAPDMIYRSAAETIKEAKRMEFPMYPAGKGKASTLRPGQMAYAKMEAKKEAKKESSPRKGMKKMKKMDKGMG